jgi:hypothetical protein
MQVLFLGPAHFEASANVAGSLTSFPRGVATTFVQLQRLDVIETTAERQGESLTCFFKVEAQGSLGWLTSQSTLACSDAE